MLLTYEIRRAYSVYDGLLRACDDIVGGVVGIADDYSLERWGDGHSICRKQSEEEGDECEAHVGLRGCPEMMVMVLYTCGKLWCCQEKVTVRLVQSRAGSC